MVCGTPYTLCATTTADDSKHHTQCYTRAYAHRSMLSVNFARSQGIRRMCSLLLQIKTLLGSVFSSEIEICVYHSLPMSASERYAYNINRFEINNNCIIRNILYNVDNYNTLYMEVVSYIYSLHTQADLLMNQPG